MVDSKDKRILDLLQRDADMSVAEIAAAVNLTTGPCWRRIKRLETQGVIKARVALLDRDRLNLSMTIFVIVRAAEHSLSWLEDFKTVIHETPEIVEAYRLTGDIDYLLRVVVPDMAAYDALYKRLIGRLAFADVSSSISMEDLKFTTALPTNYLK